MSCCNAEVPCRETPACFLPRQPCYVHSANELSLSWSGIASSVEPSFVSEHSNSPPAKKQAHLEFRNYSKNLWVPSERIPVTEPFIQLWKPV